MPCHHALDEYLHAYIDGAQIAADSKGFLFRSSVGRSGVLTERPMGQTDVYRKIGRRADRAGVKTKIGCHTFRATGIIEYLRNGGDSKSRSRWPIMNRRVRLDSTIGAMIKSRSMRSNEF